MSCRRTFLVALAGAGLVLAGCTPEDDPAPTAEPSADETASSGEPEQESPAEVAQEAIRLWNADRDDEPNKQDAACELFTSDAIQVAPGNDGPTVPMSRWCGEQSDELIPEPVWEVAGRAPSIEEEERRPGGERWVRLMVGSYEHHQYVAALTESADDGGWLIARWCSYSAPLPDDEQPGADDPFHCLRETS